MEETEFQRLKDEVDRYVNGRLRELSERIEESGECGPDIWRELRERGYLRLGRTESTAGGGLVHAVFAAAGNVFYTSRTAHIRMVVHVINGIWRPADFLANEAQREKIREAARARGRLQLAFAL